jgi:hypothetical protein
MTHETRAREPRSGRAGDIIGRTVRDAAGRRLGSVADLITETTPDSAERVVAALVVAGPWGRLLGYERDEATGPWILEQLARRVLRRHSVTVAWPELRLESVDATEG